MTNPRNVTLYENPNAGNELLYFLKILNIMNRYRGLLRVKRISLHHFIETR